MKKFKILIKTFKEWLIIKLGGNVRPRLLPPVAISYTYLKPVLYKVTYVTNMRNILLSDENFIKETLYAKVAKEILPQIVDIKSTTYMDEIVYTLTVNAIPISNEKGEQE